MTGDNFLQELKWMKVLRTFCQNSQKSKPTMPTDRLLPWQDAIQTLVDIFENSSDAQLPETDIYPSFVDIYKRMIAPRELSPDDTYISWIACCCGYPDKTVATVFNSLRTLLNGPAKEMLRKVPVPLLHSMTPTSFDSWPDPATQLKLLTLFFFDPIKQLIETQSILSKSEAYRYSFDGDILEFEFIFWHNLYCYSLRKLAEFETGQVRKMYDSRKDKKSRVLILLRCWQCVSVCLIMDCSLVEDLLRFADHLLEMENLFSARAIGLGLRDFANKDSKVFEKYSGVWDIINPENSSECKNYMDTHPLCLRPIFPYMRSLELSETSIVNTLQKWSGKFLRLLGIHSCI